MDEAKMFRLNALTLAPPLALALALAAAPAIPADYVCSPACDWGYGPGTGPDRWGEVCCPQCNGRRQSPINIQPGKARQADLPEIAVSYQESHMELENDGRTVGVVDRLTPGANYIEIDGRRYDFRGFHFHSLSEHTIGGRHRPMEMHIVHRRTSYDIAILAVMLDEGPELNAAYAPIFNSVPNSDSVEPRTIILDPDVLLPESMGYYTYFGSQTTPNCLEVVTWYVLKEPVLISSDQIDAFRAVFSHNYRPIQEPNGRFVRMRD